MLSSELTMKREHGRMGRVNAGTVRPHMRLSTIYQTTFLLIFFTGPIKAQLSQLPPDIYQAMPQGEGQQPRPAEMHAQPAASFRVQEAQALDMKLRSRKKALIAAVAGTPVVLFTFYHNNEKFKYFIDHHAAGARDFLIRSVAVPTIMKFEQLKDEGLSKSDLFKIGLFIGALYGLKKLADSMHLWYWWKTGDSSKTKEALNSFYSFLYNRKGKIGLASLVGLLGYFSWKVVNAAHELSKVPLFDQFFLSLTNEQRALILESESLKLLVSESESQQDPTLLLNDETFVSLLTDAQKNKLIEAADDYMRNNSIELLLQEN